MNFFKEHLMGVLLPLIVAPLTVLVGRIVLNAHEALDGLKPWQKQGVVVVIAGALTAMGALLGDTICGGQACAGDFSNLDVKALVSAALAFVLHEGLKPKPGRAQ